MVESTLYHGHPAWSCFYGRLSLAGIFLMIASEQSQASAGLSVAIFFILFVVFGRFRRSYIITSQRISMRTGLVANNTGEMEIQHIRGINIRQNILERLLGIGDLEMTSVANGNTRIIFQGVKKPEKIKELIYSVRGFI